LAALSLDDWMCAQATARTASRLVLVWAAHTDVLMQVATLWLVLLWLIAPSPKVGDRREPLVEE
jgi:hypothetical protein